MLGGCSLSMTSNVICVFRRWEALLMKANILTKFKKLFGWAECYFPFSSGWGLCVFWRNCWSTFALISWNLAMFCICNYKRATNILATTHRCPGLYCKLVRISFNVNLLSSNCMSKLDMFFPLLSGDCSTT